MTITHTPTPSNSEIIKTVTEIEWQQAGYEGEPPIPTPNDLKPHEPVQIAHDRAGGLKLDTIRKMPIPLVRQMFGVEGPIYQTPELGQALDAVQDEFENTGETTVGEIQDRHPDLWEKSGTLFAARGFFNFGVFLIADFAERIEAIHQTWLEVRRFVPDMPHPLAAIVRAWLTEQKHRTIKTATVDHVQDLTTIPYAVSEVNRRKWETVGSVDAIEVDGEPIITQMRQLPGAVHANTKGGLKVYKPKGTQGEFLPMQPQRDKMEIPIPLVAYQEFGESLNKPIAPDVAQLLTIAYAVNEPLMLTIEEGASLLAHSEEGSARKIQTTDKQRFINAFACIYGGLPVWIERRGIQDFFPLTSCDRLPDDRFSIAAASWAKNRKDGRWTLTAGFGRAGKNRLKGDAHTNNIWRVVGGVEHWLARERFVSKGTFKRTSQALIPTSGTKGHGNWYTLRWQKLMMIAGDVWDGKDKDANNRAYKRFQKIRDTLKQHGYEVKSLNRPAEAGDTVEFLFERRAQIKVRATARFVEGARKANRQDWQTVGLSHFLGF